ncbi:MAG: peptidoglycan hydrolase-like protein with peptidoglycan-binding domain [Crocinitomicaceae bacterium]|jgi:peptidoglycan hydrolase-like protein with peptidoglycan-binding domain
MSKRIATIEGPFDSEGNLVQGIVLRDTYTYYATPNQPMTPKELSAVKWAYKYEGGKIITFQHAVISSKDGKSEMSGLFYLNQKSVSVYAYINGPSENVCITVDVLEPVQAESVETTQPEAEPVDSKPAPVAPDVPAPVLTYVSGSMAVPTHYPIDATQEISAAVGARKPVHKNDILLVQQLLNNSGFPIGADGNFGNQTKTSIKLFQKFSVKGTPDGIIEVGGETWQGLINPVLIYIDSFDKTYKNGMYAGSAFPNDPIRNDVATSLHEYVISKYIPELNKTLADSPKGIKLLLTIMTNTEGYYPNTRSYRNNNPGNIGNTDDGSEKSFPTLAEGILAQKTHAEAMVAAINSEQRVLRPYFSLEIAMNQKNYACSPWLPGYTFNYTGQLDQYVKIYATAARGGNGYMNKIISYFKTNGLIINERTILKDIIEMD